MEFPVPENATNSEYLLLSPFVINNDLPLHETDVSIGSDQLPNSDEIAYYWNVEPYLNEEILLYNLYNYTKFLITFD